MKHVVDETWNSFHLFFWMDMLTRSISSPNNHYTQICNFSIIKITALLSSLSYWTDGYMWNVRRTASSLHRTDRERRIEAKENNRIFRLSVVSESMKLSIYDSEAWNMII